MHKYNHWYRIDEDGAESEFEFLPTTRVNEITIKEGNAEFKIRLSKDESRDLIFKLLNAFDDNERIHLAAEIIVKAC